VMVSIDLTGEPLFMRGWRMQVGEAPLKEHLAAGLSAMTDWNYSDISPEPMIDPMCGSGTLLIESAMRARGRFGDRWRKGYLCQRLSHFKAGEFDRELSDMLALAKNSGPPLRLFGYDRDPAMVRAAEDNIKRAGLSKDITVSVRDLSSEPAESIKQDIGFGMGDFIDTRGVILTNPPYGERIGADQDLPGLYRKLGDSFKACGDGWRAYALSGDPELAKFLRLKADRKWPVWNGPIECRLLKYQIQSKRLENSEKRSAESQDEQ
jgi:putative N6-adenine-specific DNA methylase